MNAFVELPATAAATASQTIPYRTESPVTAGQALSVLGMAVALLAAAVGLLLWARRRGWLQRWSAAAAARGTFGRHAPRILGQSRLGQATRAYVVEVDGARFMIVESSKQVSLHVLPEDSAIPGNGA